MPLIGTNMPNIPSYHVSNLGYRAPEPQKLKLYKKKHLTKSPKLDHIYKLCLYTLEEHKC